MAHPDWLDFVQPFGALFLGIGASVVAYRQWSTAHEKLRLDLFDRRVALYSDFVAKSRDLIATRRNVLYQTIEEINTDNAKFLELDALALRSVFLFDDDLASLFDEAVLELGLATEALTNIWKGFREEDNDAEFLFRTAEDDIKAIQKSVVPFIKFDIRARKSLKVLSFPSLSRFVVLLKKARRRD